MQYGSQCSAVYRTVPCERGGGEPQEQVVQLTVFGLLVVGRRDAEVRSGTAASPFVRGPRWVRRWGMNVLAGCCMWPRGWPHAATLPCLAFPDPAVTAAWTRCSLCLDAGAVSQPHKASGHQCPEPRRERVACRGVVRVHWEGSMCACCHIITHEDERVGWIVVVLSRFGGNHVWFGPMTCCLGHPGRGLKRKGCVAPFWRKRVAISGAVWGAERGAVRL